MKLSTLLKIIPGKFYFNIYYLNFYVIQNLDGTQSETQFGSIMPDSNYEKLSTLWTSFLNRIKNLNQ